MIKRIKESYNGLMEQKRRHGDPKGSAIWFLITIVMAMMAYLHFAHLIKGSVIESVIAALVGIGMVVYGIYDLRKMLVFEANAMREIQASRIRGEIIDESIKRQRLIEGERLHDRNVPG